MNNSIVKATVFLLAISFISLLPSCGKDESESESTDSYDNTSYADSTPAAQPEPSKPTRAEIKFNMEPGEKHTFTIHEEIDLTEQNKSRITKSRVKFWIEIEIIIECLEIDESDGAFIVAQDWVRAKGGDATYDWDSYKNLRPPDYAKRWRRLPGKYIKLAILPDGEIGEIWNGDVLADAILYEKGVDKKDYDEDEMWLYESQLESMLDSVWESKEGMIPPLPRGYPDKPMNYGDTWTTKERVSSSRSGYTITKMELKKFDNDTATFDAKTSLVAGDDLTDGNILMKVEDNMVAAGKGEIEIDLKTGLIKYCKIKSNIDYDAKIDDRLWQKERNKKFTGYSITTIKMID